MVLGIDHIIIVGMGLNNGHFLVLFVFSTVYNWFQLKFLFFLV